MKMGTGGVERGQRMLIFLLSVIVFLVGFFLRLIEIKNTPSKTIMLSQDSMEKLGETLF